MEGAVGSPSDLASHSLPNPEVPGARFIFYRAYRGSSAEPIATSCLEEQLCRAHKIQEDLEISDTELQEDAHVALTWRQSAFLISRAAVLAKESTAPRGLPSETCSPSIPAKAENPRPEHGMVSCSTSILDLRFRLVDPARKRKINELLTVNGAHAAFQDEGWTYQSYVPLCAQVRYAKVLHPDFPKAYLSHKENNSLPKLAQRIACGHARQSSTPNRQKGEARDAAKC